MRCARIVGYSVDRGTGQNVYKGKPGNPDPREKEDKRNKEKGKKRKKEKKEKKTLGNSCQDDCLA